MSWLMGFLKNERHSEQTTFFRSISLFHGFSGRQLGRVILSLQKRHYHAGEIVFEEGQTGKAVFIVKSGQVELKRRSGESTRTLCMVGPGQFFGEMALLENAPRTATAVAAEDGEIYLLYTSALDVLTHNYPEIGVKLLRNIAVMLSALLRKSNKENDLKAKVEQ